MQFFFLALVDVKQYEIFCSGKAKDGKRDGEGEGKGGAGLGLFVFTAIEIYSTTLNSVAASPLTSGLTD